MLRSSLVLLAVLVLLASPAAFAGDPDPAPPPRPGAHVGGAASREAAAQAGTAEPKEAAEAEEEEEEEEEEGEDPRFSGTASFEVTNRYLYRGFVLEDEGFIGFPAVEMQYALCRRDTGLLRSVSVRGEAWAVLATGPFGVDGDNEDPEWYAEQDLYAGLVFGLAGGFELSAQYVWFLAPNDVFEQAEEVVVGLSWDDEERWSCVQDRCVSFRGFQPSLVLGQETKGQQDEGDDLGTYLGLSVEPTFRVGRHENTAWTVYFPVTLGLSLADYYEEPAGDDHTFGYVEAGAFVSIPLGATHACESPWALDLGVKATFLSDELQTWNEEDEVLWTFSCTVSFSF